MASSITACILLLRVCATSTTSSNQAPHTQPPHVVYIMADDVGWYNVGWHNPEMKTPNMDALIEEEGVELDRVYAYHYCSPTRSSFLSGRLPLHVTQINIGGSAINFHGKTYLEGVDVRMTMLPKKLAAAGYVSYQIGDYSYEQIPVARGFNHSFGYLSGGEDHYRQLHPPGVDLWRDEQPAYGENGTYGAFLYTNQAVKWIAEHRQRYSSTNSTNSLVQAPMFMYLAYQNNHCPLQVPDRFIDPSITDDKRRQVLHGMTNCLDESVGNVTKALKAAGMWDNTLLIFSSDNGGAVHEISDCEIPCLACTNGMTSAANNYPLRGGKISDFEGGVRVAAFLAGGKEFFNTLTEGAWAASRSGRRLQGMMAIADFHATICSLAGVPIADPVSFEGVPPVDGIDMSSYLRQQLQNHHLRVVDESPRSELMLSCLGNSSVVPANSSDEKQMAAWTGGALIVGRYKLVYGSQLGMGFHTGPRHPNGTADIYPNSYGCGTSGCLFDIRSDPTESRNLNVNPNSSIKTLVVNLAQKYAAHCTSFFQSSQIFIDATHQAHRNCSSLAKFAKNHRGFRGPYCT